MTAQEASHIALTALGWLAGKDDLLPVFLGASGAAIEDLKREADTAELQGAVLDFLLMDDAWVMACAAETGLDPTGFFPARQALPGGALPNWT